MPVEVRSQAELDVALKERDPEVHIAVADRFSVSAVIGWLRLTMVADCYVEAWESSHVEARGSSHVEARGSSHVEAWGSSHVVARGSSHVVARGSSHVVARGSSHVVAWGSSHVVAWGSSHVEAWGNVFLRLFSALKITASASVVIMMHGQSTSITGGKRIKAVAQTTPKLWCEINGVEIKKGCAVVFKGLNDKFTSGHGSIYKPKTTTVAADWDKGNAECGCGLHFSPTAAATKEFARGATVFMACAVKFSDMRSPKADDQYPNKIKAKQCKNLYEVDVYGNKK